MPRGRVVRDAPVIFGVSNRHRSSRLDDLDDGCRQRAHAGQAAALCAGGLRVIVRRNWDFVGDHCRAVNIDRFYEMRLAVRMFMYVTAAMDMPRYARAVVMHMNDAKLVPRVRETRRQLRPARKRERGGRRQHAKQIDQGEKVSRP